MTDKPGVPEGTITTFHQRPDRRIATREEMEAVLDEGMFCFVALTDENQQPYAFPTLYARDGNCIYLHGARQSHIEKAGMAGKPICATVALLDGYAFGRAAWAHDAHYRSVMIFGVPKPVTEVAARRRAMEVFENHVSPGLWEGTRQPTEEELAAPAIMKLDLDTMSGKTSEKFPIDPKADVKSDHWAGKVFFHTTATAEASPDVNPDVPIPAYVPEGPYKRRI